MLEKFNAAFGAKLTAAQKEKYKNSPHYHNGKFANLVPLYTIYQAPDFVDDSIHPRAERFPNFEIPCIKINPQDLAKKPERARITWFGHSTILLEIDGKNILIDPMFSPVPSPIQFIGYKRFSKGLPLTISELPEIDAVLLTHDHYDHLDYKSIKEIKSKVKRFYTPLALSVHLIAWGVEPEKIQELDWFETTKFDSLHFTLTPSHHYSGRSLSDRFSTLWGGWVIKGEKENIYLSGDGGYGLHFRKIGELYGPFDFAMIECGQYCSYWKQNHLYPEQTAQVALDVKAKLIMPIHWGAFALAMHRWAAPVERLLKKTEILDIQVVVPMIGESITLGSEMPKVMWWKG